MKKVDAITNTIIFEYEVADLFNNVSLKTSYKSRMISDDGRIVDDLTMLDDDQDAFRANILKILADIYERIVKLTSSITDAYALSDTSVTIKLQNNDAYNENVLDIVDASIYECLETGSMKEWYSICGKVDFEQEYTNKYITALRLLSNRMFQLKKKTIKNTLGNLSDEQ